MPVESQPRNTRGPVRLAWGVSALVAIAAWAVGCGEPQSPIATGRIPAQTVEVGNTESLDLAGYFSDADGDVLSYSATSSDPGVATTAVSGTAVRVTAVAAGNAKVTVTALDPGGLSADQTFAVTVPNRAPVAVGRIPDAETFVGDSVEIAFAGYFDDPDGDALTYAVASSDPGIVVATFSGANVRVAGVSQGVATVTLTARDPGGLSATQTFSATVPNRSPEAVGQIDDVETFVGESVEIELEGYFSDPDGDDLAYSATSSNTRVVTVSVAGATLRLAGGGQGSATVAVIATDVGGLTAEQGFTTSVTDRDRGVLEILYDSTDGDNWLRNANWKSTAPLDWWYGISTDSSGRVTEIILDWNDLTGSIPAELGDLANLEILDLDDNELSGLIPSELGGLASLEILDLDDNELSGLIPSELGGLANLEILDLGRNDLTGSIPAELGDLANLKDLLLDWNDLTAIPAELGGLASLEILDLHYNELHGSIPAELGDLANLDTLDLSHNDLTGSIPSELGDLANLSGLDLSWNELTGSIPAELGDLANLSGLDLSWNELTGSIPAELGGLANLEFLDLSSNELSGSIPAELGDLANLSGLDLSSNELSGSIPAELGDLANLSGLDLDWNELTGSIPAELGDLANLEWLNLSANALTGSIPAELGDLANLDTLDLHDNYLTGSIPAELGDLANLEKLYLHWNDLTGSIPAELGDLANLSALALQRNKLTGSTPNSFLDLTLSWFSFNTNYGLCVPNTDDFDKWLDEIERWSGPRC